MQQSPVVLIIDDDVDDQDLFVEAVQDVIPAVKCVSVSDGEAALAYLLDANPLPDFIFLDLNMPRLDGRQCLEQIRRHKQLDSIIITVYTTSSRQEDIQCMKDLGATFYLTKPSKFDQLRDAVHCVLRMDKECADITGLLVL